MSKEMDLDGFLGHTTRGPSANFLDGWKKRSPPQVKIVLHTKAPIMAVWQHQWPKIVTREKDGREVREVWSGAFNSWETEEILTKQYQRDDSEKRVHPPVICPMSIMLEEVHRLYEDGQLEWDTALFRFVGDDITKAKTLHTAGMLNRAAKVWETLTEQQRRDAKKRGMPGPSDAWMENMLAKCSYVFSVVDYDAPKDGIQIAKETTLVGDKMKKVIRDRMTSEGDDKGHPFLHPYVFQWSHNPTAKNFGDKYDVVAIGKLPITDAIRQLVIETPAPDISRWTGKGDIEALRASMEDAYCGPEGLLDFDFIFAKAEALNADGKAEPDDEDGASAEDVADAITDPEPESEPEPEPEQTVVAKQPARRQRKAEPPAPVGDPLYVISSREKDADGDEKCYAADGMELFACDECSTIIRADESTCRQCGAEYEVEVEPTPEPVKSAKPVPAKPAPKPAPASVKPTPAKPAQAPQAAKPAQAQAKPAQSTPVAARAAQKPAGAAPAEANAKGAGRDRLGF
jgi:hypothetical protein